MRLSLALTIAALAGSVTAQQEPLQVYLFPTPSGLSHASAPTLAADQASAVFAHHLGQPISDRHEMPSDERRWGHLLGMWRDSKATTDKARVVIVHGVLPQDVLPSTFLDKPSFYLASERSVRNLLAPYLDRASSLLDNILDIVPGLPDKLLGILDFAESHIAKALHKELLLLSSLSESLSKHAGSWDAVSISSLSKLDRADKEWNAGCDVVKAGLESMTAPGSPPLLVIIAPSGSTLSRRAFSDLPEEYDDELDEFADWDDVSSVQINDGSDTTSFASNGTVKVCYASDESCSSSTTCSGRGVCAYKGKSHGEECWGCRCSSGYAGVACQKEDYTVPFVILVISSLGLIGTLVGSVALLWSVGETKLPSTLNLAVGGPKRD